LSSLIQNRYISFELRLAYRTYVITIFVYVYFHVNLFVQMNISNVHLVVWPKKQKTDLFTEAGFR